MWLQVVAGWVDGYGVGFAFPLCLSSLSMTFLRSREELYLIGGALEQIPLDVLSQMHASLVGPHYNKDRHAWLFDSFSFLVASRL